MTKEQEPITWIEGKDNCQIAVRNMPIDKMQKICAIIEEEEQQPCEDCISRQAVIRLVEQYPNIIGNRCSGLIADIKHLPSVTPRTNLAESSQDCVRRESVNKLIDELARAISDERCCISRGRDTATIMQDILDLPPITPSIKEWLSSFNTESATECFTAVQELKKEVTSE